MSPRTSNPDHSLLVSRSFLLVLRPLLILLSASATAFFRLSRHAVNRPAATTILLLLSLLSTVLAFLLRGLLLLLLLAVLDLVLDQVVEGGDGADQAAEVDGHELVVGLDAHGVAELGVGLAAGGPRAGLGGREVGEEVEDVLEVAEDGVVDGELAVEDLLEVGLDVTEAQVKALQGLELVREPRREGADGDVPDVPE